MKYLLIFVCCSAFTSLAQNESPIINDTLAIRSVIDQLFLGMQKGDSSIVGAQFAENTHMLTTFIDKEGNLRSLEESVEEFKSAVGTPHTEVWNERISNVVIQIDDLLAQVWMDYSFYVDETFSHCGVNAMQLIKSENGWKIVHLIDTRRRTNCH